VTMDVARYDDAEAFRRDARPVLQADAPRNNLILAILHTLVDRPDIYPTFHLWIARRDGAALGAALQTEPYHLVLAEPIEPAAIEAIADAAVDDGHPLPGVTAGLPWSDRFAERVAERTGARVERVITEGVWVITDVADVPPAAGAMRVATPDDEDLVLRWLVDFHHEALPPDHPRDDDAIATQVRARLAGEGGGYRLWEDGEPVAMAGFHDVPGLGSRVGPVYTPPAFRRRGYATRLVAEMSAGLLERGDPACYLYTDMANPTSNAIYARIGYVMLGEAAENAFRDP
jgi:uncharacterized protein